MAAAYRYAIYLAPASPWRELGGQWLGRSPETGQAVARPAGADPRLDEWTREPRLYGLHATLKAPFRLREGASPAALDAAMRTLARGFRPFAAPLRLRRLRGFLAWCLDEGDAAAVQAMQSLADTAVAELDAFRAPATPEELVRRRPHRLDPVRRALLERWGYPHVFQGFTFHITLTGSLPEPELDEAEALLRAAAAAAALPPAMPVRAVSVYVQPEPGAPFLVARHYGFDGSTADAAGAGWLASR